MILFMFIGLIPLIALCSGSPTGPNFVIFPANEFISDTPEVVAARLAHLAAVEEAKWRLNHQKLPKIPPAPEITNKLQDKPLIPVIPFVAEASKDREIIEDKSNPQYKEQTGVRQNDKFIVLELDNKEEVKHPAYVKIYLPYIVNNNNPNYKYFVSAIKPEKIQQKTEVDAESKPIISEQFSGSAMSSTNDQSAVVNFVNNINDKFAQADKYVDKFVENYFGITTTRPVEEHHAPVNFDVKKEFDNYLNKVTAAVSVNKFVSNLENKQAILSTADDYVEKFVSNLPNLIESRPETINKIPVTIDEIPETTNKTPETIDKTPIIDKIPDAAVHNENTASSDINNNYKNKDIDDEALEKFLTNLEKKYLMGTAKLDSLNLERFVDENIHFVEKKPDNFEQNFFDERLNIKKQTNNVEHNIEMVKENIPNLTNLADNLKQVVNDDDKLNNFLQNLHTEGVGFLKDVFKILAQQIDKYFKELLSDSDRVKLEHAVKNLLKDLKEKETHKTMEGF